MTTTSGGGHGGPQARRRLAVRLTMLAGSALTLAVSWLGVVQADRGQPAAVLTAPQPVAVTAVTSATAAVPPASDGTLVPAPSPARQVIVVRRSRAS